MKNIISTFVLSLWLITSISNAQDITNTLAPNGNFKIKDGTTDYLSLSQSTGEVNILKTLRLENTTSPSLGVIFKGADRFIHNYRSPGIYGGNIFIGINSGNFTLSGSNYEASYNTALGDGSLKNISTGSRNTALGSNSLNSNTTGNYNTAVGYQSLDRNTTGYYNTASGIYALIFNTTGYENTAIGSGALNFNTTGYDNTATGFSTLVYNTTGYHNTANGYNALYSNTTGGFNIALGSSSLYFNTTGTYNTANGYAALYSNTTGNQNTALGYAAYPTVATTNYTGIGYNVGGASSVSNSVEIGNSSVGWIGGQVGWSIYSDERIKDNVSENVPGLAFINKLRPVTYNLNIHKQNEMMYKGKGNQEDWASKYDIEKIRMTGFIAQEVEKAAQDINYNFSGVEKSKDENGIYSIRYSEFVVPLVKAVQEQQATIQNQQKTIQDLTKRIEQLERK